MVYNFLEVIFLSKIKKFLKKLLRYPVPNDIEYDEMARFLIIVGCIVRKKGGTSHRQFKHPGYHKTITLMENTNIRKYQVEEVKELLVSIGIIEEDNDER